MPLKHDRTAESHTGVYGGKKKNFFSSFTYKGWVGYIMPEKHDQTAESRAGVLGQKKKNFFFFFYIHRMGGVTKCSRNTIFFSSAYTGWGSYIMHEKHDRTAESHAGVPGQIKKNFFLLLHTQDGGELYYASETRSNS